MYQELLDVLKPTLLNACRSALDKYPDEHFYSVALFTSDSYRTVADTFSTSEGLEKVAKEYFQQYESYREEWGTVEVGMKDLKWSPCDSPRHLIFDESFYPIDEVIGSIWDAAFEAIDKNEDAKDEDYEAIEYATCKKMHETFAAALASVRNAGLFNNEQVVFNILFGDQSEEERLLNAEELNSETTLAWYRKELEIDQELMAKLKKAPRWSDAFLECFY